MGAKGRKKMAKEAVPGFEMLSQVMHKDNIRESFRLMLNELHRMFQAAVLPPGYVHLPPMGVDMRAKDDAFACRGVKLAIEYCGYMPEKNNYLLGFYLFHVDIPIQVYTYLFVKSREEMLHSLANDTDSMLDELEEQFWNFNESIKKEADRLMR